MPEETVEPVGRIDITKTGEWQTPPVVEFEKVASLTIATWILAIFAGICALAFGSIWLVLQKDDATFKEVADMLKFMVQAVIPLVTLAVGYYLGDRSGSTNTEE